MRDLPYLDTLITSNAVMRVKVYDARENNALTNVRHLKSFDLVQLTSLYFANVTSDITFKCGLAVTRRVYRYQDIILAFIFSHVGIPYPEIDINEAMVNPSIYCQRCSLSLFERMTSNQHCELCHFTRMARFHTSLFELPLHFYECDGSLATDRMIRNAISHGDDSETESDDDSMHPHHPNSNANSGQSESDIVENGVSSTTPDSTTTDDDIGVDEVDEVDIDEIQVVELDVGEVNDGEVDFGEVQVVEVEVEGEDVVVDEVQVDEVEPN